MSENVLKRWIGFAGPSFSESRLRGPRLGDQEQVELLYRSHAQLVLQWAVRLGIRNTEAPDVVQEVFLVAQRRLASRPRGPEEINRWLFGLTRRVVYEVRKRDRRISDVIESIGELPEVNTSGQLADNVVQQRQRLEQLHKLLATLREQERTAFLLYELSAMNSREVAELMNVSLNTFWTHMNRARAKILRRLGALEERE